MHEHLVVIFGLMAERRVHLELGKRSGRSMAESVLPVFPPNQWVGKSLVAVVKS